MSSLVIRIRYTRCVLIKNVLNFILCYYQMYGDVIPLPDGEPDLESLTMAFFETRDAGNIYYLQGYTGDMHTSNKSW